MTSPETPFPAAVGREGNAGLGLARHGTPRAVVTHPAARGATTTRMTATVLAALALLTLSGCYQVPPNSYCYFDQNHNIHCIQLR